MIWSQSIPKRCNIYLFEAKPFLGLTAAILNEKITFAKLLHERLVHIGRKCLKSLQNQGVFGKINLSEVTSCE